MAVLRADDAPRRMLYARAHLQLYAAGVIALIGAVQALGPVPLDAQVLWFLLPAAAFGLFHGGGDPALAEPMAREVAGRFWYPAFFVAYALCGLLAYLVWQSAALFALAAFLVLAVWHFGRTDSFGHGAVETIGRGLLIVALSYAAAPELSIWAYSAFVGRALPSVEALTPASWVFAAGAFSMAAMAIARSSRETRVASGLHLVATTALFLLTPPLIAFACYFGLWHSVRHMLEVDTGQQDGARSFRRRYALHASINSALVLVLAGVIARSGLSGGLDSAHLAQVVFVGLFCLTVPHFALVDLARHRMAARPSRGFHAIAR